VVLVLAGVSRSGRIAWPIAVTACSVAAAFSLVAQSGWLPGNTNTSRIVTFGQYSAPVLDSRGDLIRYLESGLNCTSLVKCLHGPPSMSQHAYLGEWLKTSQRATDKLYTDARLRGRLPVVFFAAQDPIFNTNSVLLDYQLEHHQALPVGVLLPRSASGLSFNFELESPNWGEPNLVITGPASSIPSWRGFSQNTNLKPVVAALRADGFTPIDHVTLPDGRVMRFWWKLRGPVPS
jgi:hypothetical protein